MRSFKYLLLLLTCLASNRSFALFVQPANLEGLIDASDQVFVGTVLSIQDDKALNGLRAFVTTFKVREIWKGNNTTGTISVRQVGTANPIRSGVLADLPRFQVGETAVVFLRRPSRIGLASPAGLHQGVFRFPAKENKYRDDALLVHSGNPILFQQLRGSRLISRTRDMGFENSHSPVLRLGELRELVQIHQQERP